MKQLGGTVGDEKCFRPSRLKAFFVFLRWKTQEDEGKVHNNPVVHLLNRYML